MPLVSVITPASRSAKVLAQLFRDFKNQTFADFEHILVYDGKVPADVQVLADQYKKLYNLRFYSIEKDMGNVHWGSGRACPGNKPRNYGLSMAKGKYVIYADDDNRYRGDYLEAHVMNIRENSITVTQVACSESRIYKNGKPDRIVVIPEIGLPTFPIICHVDTANFMLPIKWALENPWIPEPENDFRMIKRVVEKYKPTIFIKNGIHADLDGLVTKGLRDWVTVPPFLRG